MTNMTYAVALEIAIDAVDDLEVKEKLEALKTQLAKRSSSKSLTKTQKENEVIMEKILETLSMMEGKVTVTELLTFGIEGFELTNQKVSALLKKLVDAGKVEKTMDGKKARFSLA